MDLNQDLKGKPETRPESPPKERKRVKRVLVYLLAFTVLVGLTALLNYKKLGELYRLYQMKAQVAKEIEAIKKENAGLSTEIKKMQKDNAYIEEQARKELNMVKPGEVVYQPVPKEPEKKEGEKAGGSKQKAKSSRQ